MIREMGAVAKLTPIYAVIELKHRKCATSLSNMRLTAHLYSIMERSEITELLKNYLDSMHTLPPPNLELMKVLTLSELRSRARTPDGKKITQKMFAKMIGRSLRTVGDWEKGIGLKGVNTSDIIAIGAALNCQWPEVITVIENTKNLNKDETQQ